MAERQMPPATLEGWFVLHQLFRLAWPEIKRLSRSSEQAPRRLGEEFAELLGGWERPGDGGWSGGYRMVGGGVDYLLLHFRPTLEELGEAERRIQRSGLGDYLTLVRDYVSVVELGLYGVTADVAQRLEREGRAGDPAAWEEEVERAREEQGSISWVRQRLRPVQPEGFPYVCFYPMSKRREAGHNWYELPLEERNELMHEHGRVGRRYADRISQVISGSVGLDDWEWAVTLFGRQPLDFKDVVTDMRYDRVSAQYAEFGEFYVGKRMEAAAWGDPEAW